MLHNAAMSGDGRTFEILIAADLRGLKTDTKDNKSMTARQYLATRSGLPLETVNLFETLLENINEANLCIGNQLVLDSDEDDEFFDALEDV